MNFQQLQSKTEGEQKWNENIKTREVMRTATYKHKHTLNLKVQGKGELS